MCLSTKIAYEAMIIFLEKFYAETNSDEIAGLLSDLQLLSDGISADPAAWQNWLRSVEEATKRHTNKD